MIRSPWKARGWWPFLLLGAAASALAAWSWPSASPDRLFLEAREELAAERVDRAEECLARLERLRTPGPFDRLLRAQVAEAGHHPEVALGELARIADGQPLAPVARLLAGQIEMKRRRLRPAEAAFLATLALEPRSVKPRRELVYLYNLQHRQRDLDEQLRAMSELGPMEYEYLVHWAKTRNVVWNPERDCEVLAACVQADPGDRASRLALAEGLRRMTRPLEALEAIAPLAESDPEARAIRALIALDQGDEAGLARLIAAAPVDDPRLATIRGQLALKEGDAPSAARQFRIALGADPSDRSSLFGLGNALRQAGDPSAGEPYLLAARRHDAVTPLVAEAATGAGEADPTLPSRIGLACEAAGRTLEASAWFRLAVARDPADVKAQEGLARLAGRGPSGAEVGGRR